MSMITEEQGQKLRLNPFAFPSETDFRFVLLIVLVVSICLSHFYEFILTIPHHFSKVYFDKLGECQEKYLELLELSNSSSSASLEALQSQLDCVHPMQLELAWRVIGGVATVLTVATLLYWFIPYWKLRRYKLQALTADDAPEVLSYLTNLCQEMKLLRQPTFVWNPLDSTRSGLAFGNLSRQYVSMSMGLISQFYVDQSAFRSVMLHELSHIKNADLNKTYFTTALWFAFVVCVVLPRFLALLLFGARSVDIIIGQLWGVVLLSGLVFLVRNSILRTREFYADVRASTFTINHEDLKRVLNDTPQTEKPSWLKPFLVHPHSIERISTLNDTRQLFSCTFGVAVITGIVISIVYGVIQLWIDLLGLDVFQQSYIPSFVVGTLFIGIVGLTTWREAIANLLAPQRSQRIGKLSLGVGLGLFLGYPLYHIDIYFTNVQTSATHFIGDQIFRVSWALLGIAITYLICSWIAAGATAWSGFAASRRTPKTVYRIWLILAVGVAWILYMPLSLSLGLGEISPRHGVLSIASVPLTVAQSPLAFVSFICLWAFPLAAWFFRKQAVPIQNATWAYLASPSIESKAVVRKQLYLRPLGSRSPQRSKDEKLIAYKPKASTQIEINIAIAAKSAIIGAALFLVPLVISRLMYRAIAANGTDEVSRQTTLLLRLGFGEILLASIVQATVAAWVAARTRDLRVSHGLFAAFMAACLMAIAISLARVISAGSIPSDPRQYWDSIQMTWGWGVLVSLPMVGIVSRRRSQGSAARVNALHKGASSKLL